MGSKRRVIRRQLPVVIEKTAEEGWEFACEAPASRIEHMIRAYLAAGADRIMYAPVERSAEEFPPLMPRFDFFLHILADISILH